MKKRTLAMFVLMLALLSTFSISYAFSMEGFSPLPDSAIMRYEPCDGIHLHGSSCTPTRETEERDGILYRKYLCDWCGGTLWKRA